MERPNSRRTPRREVWWLDLGGTKNQNLESIKRRFEDCLDRFPLSSSNSLLRHFTSPMDSRLRHNLHQCPGYLREEITLASDVSKSAIISHAFPSQSEVCTICGQLVQYKCTDLEPPIIDGERWKANSPTCSKSHPAILSTEPVVGPPSNSESPVSSDMSDSGSIWIPPSPTLPIHPGRFSVSIDFQLQELLQGIKFITVIHAIHRLLDKFISFNCGSKFSSSLSSSGTTLT